MSMHVYDQMSHRHRENAKTTSQWKLSETDKFLVREIVCRRCENIDQKARPSPSNNRYENRNRNNKPMLPYIINIIVCNIYIKRVSVILYFITNHQSRENHCSRK